MTEKKLAITTDQARERVETWVKEKYNSSLYSKDITNGMIEVMLRHFYGI